MIVGASPTSGAEALGIEVSAATSSPLPSPTRAHRRRKLWRGPRQRQSQGHEGFHRIWVLWIKCWEAAYCLGLVVTSPTLFCAASWLSVARPPGILDRSRAILVAILASGSV